MAHALEVHKTMDGEDVVAVIEGSEGPLIDGRAYCDDEFVEAMENFHSAVVDAHRAHESRPLPATNGQHPVDTPPLRHSAGLTPAPLTPRRCGGRPGRRRPACRRTLPPPRGSGQHRRVPTEGDVLHGAGGHRDPAQAACAARADPSASST